MKKMKCLVVFLSILSLSGCKNKTTIRNNSEFIENSDRLKFAENLATQILEKQKKGGFYKFTKEEATITMINALTEQLQKDTYKKIKTSFGDYHSLKFHSLKVFNTNEKLDIYRFKGNFERNKDIEVRAVLNTSGKLAGFFIKPWKDSL